MALRLRRAGYRGALAAWAGFTLPSAIVLILFALRPRAPWRCAAARRAARAQVVAVAVVAQAVKHGGQAVHRPRAHPA